MFGIGVEYDTKFRPVVRIRPDAGKPAVAEFYDLDTHRRAAKINSVTVTPSGTDSISAVQIKPNKTGTGTGDLTGLEVSPRFNDAPGGALVCIKADPVIKAATSARTVSALRGIEVNIDLPSSGSAYTFTNDVSAFRTFGDFGSGHTFSAKKNIIEVALPNTSGWDYLLNLKANTGLEYDSAQGSADKKLKVLINTVDYHIPLHLASDHTRVETDVDSKTVKINSRNYTQTSGSSIGLQAKPSQTVTSTGDVIGAEFSPRANDAGTGAIIAIKADPVIKDATSARSVSAVRGLEINIDLPNAGSAITVDNDVSAIRIFPDFGAGHTFTGKRAVIQLAGVNTSQWEYLLDIISNNGDLLVTNTDTPAFGIPIRHHGTDYWIMCSNALS